MPRSPNGLAVVSAPAEQAIRPRRVTAGSAIYGQLYSAIVSLQMPPGMALQEKRIAEEFGVSRTPVRDALLRLAETGLVDIVPQSGTFVSRVPVGSIPEAVVIRKSLEGTTVEVAARTATPADISRLDSLIARQRVHADFNEPSLFHEQDEAFHEAIAGIAGYPGIWTILKTVKIQIDRTRRLTLPVSGRMDSVIREHVTIRDAIAAHDVSAAHASMMHHLSVVIPDVAQLRLQYPDYFR
jgi:DNA-binding GntR family transcriptional regulator